MHVLGCWDSILLPPCAQDLDAQRAARRERAGILAAHVAAAAGGEHAHEHHDHDHDHEHGHTHDHGEAWLLMIS